MLFDFNSFKKDNLCFRKLLMFSSLVCPSSEFFAANQNLSIDKKQMESFYSFLKEVSPFTKGPMGFKVSQNLFSKIAIRLRLNARLTEMYVLYLNLASFPFGT